MPSGRLVDGENAEPASPVCKTPTLWSLKFQPGQCWRAGASSRRPAETHRDAAPAVFDR